MDLEPSSTQPNQVYYRACHGAWRSELSLSVTDLKALRHSGMGWADRLSVRMMAAWPRWLGRFWFETTVMYDDSDTVVHTTVVRWLGISLMNSTETITLDADGRAFTMRGAQRVMGSPRTLSGHGTIDPTAQHAEYTFLWLGTTLRQTTVREDNRVTVTQKGPGFEGTQALIRQR